VSLPLSAVINQAPAGNPPNVTITNPPAVCTGATVNLKATAVTAGSDAGLTYTYFSDAAATTPMQTPEAAGAGTYHIKGTNAAGCSTIKPVVVTANLGAPGSISPAVAASKCFGESILLTASSGSAYQWFKNDVAINGATSSTYSVTTPGTYSVSITNGSCSAIASNKVSAIFQECAALGETKVFVPKAFTPNNNGANDLLRPFFINVKELRYFRIYNRWGQLVFQTRTIGEGWNGLIKGVPQPTETYSWSLECVDFTGQVIKQSGKSLLIR
jgi:gliding motility-associated-like protein